MFNQSIKLTAGMTQWQKLTLFFYARFIHIFCEKSSEFIT